MKKKIFTLAVAVASLFSMSAFAQAPNCNANGNCTSKKEGTCKVNKNKEKCQDGKQCRQGGKQRGDSAMRKAYNPFEGLNLTAQQQQKLQAIPTPAQVVKTARQGAKDNGQSAKGNAASNKLIRKDVRANYLKEIQTVLTPDQYVQFLENNYVNSGAGKKGKAMKQADRRGGQKGHKNGNGPRQEGAKQGVTAQR